MVQALDGPALVVALGTLPGWAIEDGKLRRSFIFENFDDAMAFINQVAGLARQLDHHPEWSNVYNKVHITLVTHDSGNQVTKRDIELAHEINKVAV